MILGEEDITWKQHSPQTRDEATGAAIVGETGDTVVQASVQNLSGSDRQTLPRGQRKREGWKLYTSCAMKTANQYNSTNGDLVVIDGITYEVMKSTRTRQILPHFKVLVLRRQEVDPNA